MDENFLAPLTKIFEPRPGGWSRLSVKLAENDELQRQEVRVWRAIAASLVIVISALVVDSYLGNPIPDSAFNLPQPGEVRVEGGHPVLVRGTPNGIHFYWVF